MNIPQYGKSILFSVIIRCNWNYSCDVWTYSSMLCLHPLHRNSDIDQTYTEPNMFNKMTIIMNGTVQKSSNICDGHFFRMLISQSTSHTLFSHKIGWQIGCVQLATLQFSLSKIPNFAKRWRLSCKPRIAALAVSRSYWQAFLFFH